MAAAGLGPGGHCSELKMGPDAGPFLPGVVPGQKPIRLCPSRWSLEPRAPRGEVVLVMVLVGLVFSALLLPLPDSTASLSSLERPV